ncbi:MAG: hypothetical protein KIT22_02025 [Verrucomicrobiae bacterium]|nr:hypothetical protein [Verrucomicrobiae bacterium]
MRRGGNGFKRAKGGYTVGRTITTKIGFHGAMPTAQRAGAAQAVATDPASTMALCNELRATLVEKGLIKGAA